MQRHQNKEKLGCVMHCPGVAAWAISPMAPVTAGRSWGQPVWEACGEEEHCRKVLHLQQGCARKGEGKKSSLLLRVVENDLCLV